MTRECCTTPLVFEDSESCAKCGRTAHAYPASTQRLAMAIGQALSRGTRYSVREEPVPTTETFIDWTLVS